MAFPATYNISYYQGDIYEFVLYPKNSDGTSFDITGYAVQFAINTKRGTGGTYFLGEVVPNEANNTILCRIPAALGGETLDADTTYYYDVRISKTVGSVEYVYTLVNGTISLTKDILYGE